MPHQTRVNKPKHINASPVAFTYIKSQCPCIRTTQTFVILLVDVYDEQASGQIMKWISGYSPVFSLSIRGYFAIA